MSSRHSEFPISMISPSISQMGGIVAFKIVSAFVTTKMDVGIEMVEEGTRQKSGSFGGSRISRKGHDKDEVVAADEYRDEGTSIEPILRKQNTCFALAFASLLVAISILFVGKLYMSPTEIEVAGELHDIEGGEIGIVTTISDAKQGGALHPNDNAVGDSEDFDVSHWLNNKGKVPHPFNPDDPRYKNFRDRIPGMSNGGGGGDFGYKRPGGTDSGFGKAGSIVHPARDAIFDKEKWLNSKVSLSDGKMFEVVRTLSHDPSAFIEGLAYARGQLYESTGLNGQSSIRKLNPITGEVIESYPLDDEYFGEGLTIVPGRAIQLTWKHQVGFIYDLQDLSKTPKTFHFTSTRNEGWGLAYSHELKEIAMSDGSDYIHFWDPRNLTETRRIHVKRQKAVPATNINELEFFHGRLLANIWMQDVIISIDPATGEVDKEYDFSTLYPKALRRKDHADVLNGISRSGREDLLYITGKNWDRMHLIR